MWGTVLILVPYPTTLVINVSANFTSIKSYMPANIGPPAGVVVVKTYGAKGRENLWPRLYVYQDGFKTFGLSSWGIGDLGP